MASLASILEGYIDARPAEYRGVAMRSQLEADFAKHLDNNGLPGWTYEPRIYRGEADPGYLPDFQIGSAFFEVKPTLAEVTEAARRMEVIWETNPDAVLVVACGEQCRFYTAVKGRRWESWVERWAHG